MSTRTIQMDDRLHAYYLASSLRELPLLARLREETKETGWERMQISPEQGQFMGFLVELLGAQHILEVGTFTGYSALCMALAGGPSARLVCCDVSEEWTAMAQRYWKEAGVDAQIDLRIAPGTETLAALRKDGRDGSFDMAFIDADKANYQRYFEESLALLRVGGVIAVDNIFWGGDVADPSKQDADTCAIRDLTQALHHDERVSISLVPIGDGVLLARKR